MIRKLQANSIRKYHTLIFAFMAVCILLFGTLLVWSNFSEQIKLNSNLQTELANRAASDVLSVLSHMEEEIDFFLDSHMLMALEKAEQRGRLGQLLAHTKINQHNVFESVSLFDGDGKELLRTSQRNVYGRDDLRDFSGEELFSYVKWQKATYHDNIIFDEETREPSMVMGMPIIESSSGALDGVLVADVKLKNTLDGITDLPLGETGSVYIVDARGRVVAHPDPSVVLRGTSYQVHRAAGFHPGLSGGKAMIVTKDIDLDNLSLTIVTEKPAREVLDHTYRMTKIFLAMLVTLFGVGLFTYYFIFNRIISPVEKIAAVASDVAGGNLERRASLEGVNEVSALARAFNSMIGWLVDDINRQEEAERALRLSEEKYRELVENTGDLITVVDSDIRFTYLNHRSWTIYGCPPDELDGKSPLDFVHPDDQDQTRRWLEQCLQERCARGTIENRQVNRRAGQVSHLLWTANFHYNKDGELASISSIAHDITERVQAQIEQQKNQERLQQAQKIEAIGTLAGGIAHDFNNILAIIIGSVELARWSSQNSEKTDSYLDQVLKAADRGRRLVKNILRFSRKSEQQRDAVDLKPLISEVRQMIRASLPSTIEIKEEILVKEAFVMADSNQLHQVLMNLCTNAAHAMEARGGRLTLKLDKLSLPDKEVSAAVDLADGPYCRLRVIDTGGGIATENLSQIFIPYFTTKDVDKGTGLGLSVVQAIVKNHEGAIFATSEVDRGSTFAVLLPVGESPNEKNATGDTLEELTGGTERLLVVDDEEEIADITAHRLTELGYTTEQFSDSPAALEHFRNHSGDFNLLIVDQTMPKLTGLEFIAEVKKFRPDLPILLISGGSNKISVEAARQKGVSRYLQKPTSLSVLAKSVRSLLDGAQEP